MTLIITHNWVYPSLNLKLMWHYIHVLTCLFFVFHSAVKGKTPQVGDRVLVEAVYNPNMPFKWNAQRIQTLPQLANQSVRIFRGCTQYFKIEMQTFRFNARSLTHLLTVVSSIPPSISSSLSLYLKLPHSLAAFTMSQGCSCGTQTCTPLRTTDKM